MLLIESSPMPPWAHIHSPGFRVVPARNQCTPVREERACRTSSSLVQSFTYLQSSGKWRTTMGSQRIFGCALALLLPLSCRLYLPLALQTLHAKYHLPIA